MKKQIGIWLDFKEASIIDLSIVETRVDKISSEIEHFQPRGGAHPKLRWGATENISERTYLERRKQQEKAYFQKLIDAVREGDELFIFGPAEAKDNFIKAIKNSNNFHPSVRGVERANRMTDNQKIAKVKAFFKK